LDIHEISADAASRQNSISSAELVRSDNPPHMDRGGAIQIGRVDFRNDNWVFGIKHEDRFSHVYVIGKTGTGKSTLLETMALQDLECGNGFALIDPHGDLVARIAARIPASQRDGAIYLNTTDPAQPYGYNPLRHVAEDRIALAASGMIDVFKKMWPDAWGVRMEHILRNVLIALLEQPNATLHDVLRLFSDKQFRLQVAKSLRNETVRTFLLKEFEQFSFGYRADGTAPIQNKVGAFLADPLLNRILTAPKKDLHIRRIMDQGQVLLVNLAKGQIGEDSSSLLGGLLAVPWYLIRGKFDTPGDRVVAARVPSLLRKPGWCMLRKNSDEGPHGT
jgi:Type IV secretion-system coupling protein DNA-binding domain